MTYVSFQQRYCVDSYIRLEAALNVELENMATSANGMIKVDWQELLNGLGFAP